MPGVITQNPSGRSIPEHDTATWPPNLPVTTMCHDLFMDMLLFRGSRHLTNSNWDLSPSQTHFVITQKREDNCIASNCMAMQLSIIRAKHDISLSRIMVITWKSMVATSAVRVDLRAACDTLLGSTVFVYHHLAR